MIRNLALAAALALAACTPDFDPASRVEKLRVLALRAEPPEIAPHGDPEAVHTAALTSLVVRADLDADPSRTTIVLHVACVPTPGDPTASPCATFEALRDQTAAIAAALPSACAATPDGAVVLAGVESCVDATCGAALAGGTPLRAAEVPVPARIAPAFEALRARAVAPELVLGVQAVVLAFALDASPEELVAAGAGATPCAEGDLAAGAARLWSAREHVLVTKRVSIRGPDAPDAPNRNPAIDGIAAGGVALDAGGATTIAGGKVPLTALLPPDADALHEPYTKLDADGVPIESAREDWVYSWFSTAGELDALHTRGTEADEWTVSGGAGGAPALVAAVVRDLRGGVAWTVRRVRVSD